ncbi:hypothetical protein Tco_1490510 [Tanacetum coccineum]
MAVRVPPAMSFSLSARIAEVAAMSDSAFRKRFRSSYDSSPSPTLLVRKRYRGTSELILSTDSEEEDEEVEESSDSNSDSEGAEDEGLAAGDEGPTAGDESLTAGDEDIGMRVESFGLGGDDVVPKGQQWAAPIVETAVSEPLRLEYGALRHRELSLKEDHVYSTFEVGQSSGFALEPERPERVSTFRQPTLTTWIDSEDGMVYIDVPTYPSPVPPVLTPPSPEWSSDSLPISPAPTAVPSPISSPMISLTIPSPIALHVATPTATIPVDEDQFIKARADVGGMGRACRHRMTDMSWARYDDHRLVHDLLVQQAALQREMQEMRGRITTLKQEREIVESSR